MYCSNQPPFPSSYLLMYSCSTLFTYTEFEHLILFGYFIHLKVLFDTNISFNLNISIDLNISFFWTSALLDCPILFRCSNFLVLMKKYLLTRHSSSTQHTMQPLTMLHSMIMEPLFWEVVFTELVVRLNSIGVPSMQLML